MSLLAITGRLPALSIAELESVFGSDSIKPLSQHAVIVEYDKDVKIFDQLGGTLKVANLLGSIKGTDWQTASRYAKSNLKDFTQDIPEGKITLGISVYGINVSTRIINATALEMKKLIKQTGRSVRVVPNDEIALNTAKVFHNKLDASNNLELIFVRNNDEVLVGSTRWVQNIDAYSARDQARPMRDARVGMLPPKLAQTIINLSGYDCTKTLLDPFCGTGVILQESLLMGGYCIGTDLEPRMVEYSSKNLAWLADKYGAFNYEVAEADATTHRWKENFDTIACETYLGRPLTSLPDAETLNKIMQDCNTIHKKFLQNVARQTKTGFKMCIAVPAWNTKNGFKHLPTLDSLHDLGYNRISFVHSDQSELIYYRKDQIVARELVVLERN